MVQQADVVVKRVGEPCIDEMMNQSIQHLRSMSLMRRNIPCNALVLCRANHYSCEANHKPTLVSYTARDVFVMIAPNEERSAASVLTIVSCPACGPLDYR